MELLAGIESLPHSVRFILTSRRDEDVENRLLAAGGLQLSAEQYEDANRHDLGRYVGSRRRGVAALAA